MNPVSLVWLGIMIAAIVLEAVTVQIVSVWFAAGALVTALVTLFTDIDVWAQILIFAAVSLLFMFIARPIIKKRLDKQKQPTNADMVIGKTAVVTETIDNLRSTGGIKINGTVWTALSEDGSVIQKGALVTIKQIRGVKLIVSPENTKEEL